MEMTKITPRLIYFQQRTLVTTEEEAGWTPEMLGTVLVKRKYLAPPGIQPCTL